MSSSFWEVIYPKSYINKIEEKIAYLGPNTKWSAISFINFRSISSVVLFFVILYIVSWGYIYAPIITFLYYLYLPKLVLDSLIKARCEKLENEAVYFFEVLALAIDSGQGLQNALLLASNSMDNELALEFRNGLEALVYGKDLLKILEDIKKKVPSDAINNSILYIAEAYTSGEDVVKSLENQIEVLNASNISQVKERINKIPIQISIISVLFFIPIILLLVLSPMLLSLLLG